MSLDLLDPFAVGFWIQVGVSVLCGATIGLERQLRGKPAGIRTSSFTTVGILVGVEQLEKSVHALRRGVHELRNTFGIRGGE